MNAGMQLGAMSTRWVVLCIAALAVMFGAEIAHAQWNGDYSGTYNWKFNVNQPLPVMTLGPSNLPGLQGGLTTYGTTTLGISWTTNTFTEWKINYGTAQSYGLTVSESTYFTSHTLSLNSLAPDTDYYYEIVCNDGFGHNTNSGNLICLDKRNGNAGATGVGVWRPHRAGDVRHQCPNSVRTGQRPGLCCRQRRDKYDSCCRILESGPFAAPILLGRTTASPILISS